MRPGTNTNQPHSKPRRTVTQGIITLFAAISVLFTITYTASVVISDRFAATQSISWLPKWQLVLAASAALLPIALSHAILSNSRRATTQSTSIATMTAATLTLAALLHAGLIDKTFGRAHAAPPPTKPLSVVVWNASAADPTLALNTLAPLNADLYIITHRGRTRWPDQLAQKLSNTTHAQLSNQYTTVEAWPATIVTHLSITRTQTRTLGLNQPTRPTTTNPKITKPSQPGYLIAFELDTSATLAQTTTIWILDLPSDPNLPRNNAAIQTAQRLGGPAQPSPNQQPSHSNPSQQPTTDHWAAAPAGLARPQLLVGDFNIPIGAASLKHIVGNMRHAHTTAGTSLPGTYPRRYPLLHIDHAFISHPLRAHNYSTPDPNTGTHRLQIFDITHHQHQAPRPSKRRQEHQTPGPRPE